MGLFNSEHGHKVEALKPDIDRGKTGLQQSLAVGLDGFRDEDIVKRGALLADLKVGVTVCPLIVVVDICQQAVEMFIGKKNLVERMMGANISLPAFVWPRLNIGWVLFFTFLGVANLYVMTYYDTDTWVNFKLFGMMGLTLVFIIAQGFYLTRYIQEQEPDKEEAE